MATVKEIKAQLDEKGIEYPADAKKEELEALLPADESTNQVDPAADPGEENTSDQDTPEEETPEETEGTGLKKGEVLLVEKKGFRLIKEKKGYRIDRGNGVIVGRFATEVEAKNTFNGHLRFKA